MVTGVFEENERGRRIPISKKVFNEDENRLYWKIMPAWTFISMTKRAV